MEPEMIPHTERHFDIVDRETGEVLFQDVPSWEVASLCRAIGFRVDSFGTDGVLVTTCGWTN